MTLTRENLKVLAYLTELSIFMLFVNSFLDFTIGFWYWEIGLAIMGTSIVLLTVLKDQRYDKLIITAFTWGLSFFLSDLPSFIVVMFGGGMI